jgi:hypothetical protein
MYIQEMHRIAQMEVRPMLLAIAGILSGWFTVAVASALTFGALINSRRRMELAEAKVPHRRWNEQ